MASILRPDEIGYLLDVSKKAHPRQAMALYKPAIPAATMQEAAGLRDWPVPEPLLGSIVYLSPKQASERFANPEQVDAMLQADIDQRGIVTAGSVLRDQEGFVWYVSQPKERTDGFPLITAALSRFPERSVPVALRTAARPVEAGGLRNIAHATLAGGTASAALTYPVPDGVVVLGLTNRDMVRPEDIVVADGRRSLSWTMPNPAFAPFDPDADWFDFLW